MDLSNNWIYLRLYLKDFDVLQWSHNNLFPALEEDEDVFRWFYIRYPLPGGMHLRIRINLSENAKKNKVRDWVQYLEDILPNDSQVIPLPYLPEIIKWQDQVGIEVFEEISWRGSQVSTSIGFIGYENNLLLAIGARNFYACIPVLENHEINPYVFLKNYCWYWSGGFFNAKPEMLINFENIPSETTAKLDSFANFLNKSLMQIPSSRKPKFVADILHLQHNRLGIPPKLEGTIAGLLANHIYLT